MSVLNQSGEEQVECPLCMEPLEVDDLNFFPCTCGYQICRFCWHRIRTDENGLCPACRKAYPENPADFKPLSQEEVSRLKQEKRHKDHQRKQKVTENRKHLANVRVVQRNLVFVVGLPMRLADPEVLKKHEYFGKFGKIHKVVINQSTTYAGSQGPSASAYVTYLKSDDALRAIQAVQNVAVDGRTIKTSLGTTKYCSHFMKNQPCPKPDCMYLHDHGDPEASFTKEEMQQGKHQEFEKKLHDQLINAYNKDRKPTPSPPSAVGSVGLGSVGLGSVSLGSVGQPSVQPTKEAWPSLQPGSNINPVGSSILSSASNGTNNSSSSINSSSSSNSNGSSHNNNKGEGSNQKKQQASSKNKKKNTINSTLDDVKGKSKDKHNSTQNSEKEEVHRKTNSHQVQGASTKLLRTTDRSNKADKSRQMEVEQDYRSERTDRSENLERLDKTDQTDYRSERTDKLDRLERIEKSDRLDRPDKTEKSDRVEKTERLDNCEWLEHTDISEEDHIQQSDTVPSSLASVFSTPEEPVSMSPTSTTAPSRLPPSHRAASLLEPDNNSFFSASFTKVNATSPSSGTCTDWPPNGLTHMPDVLPPVHSSEDWQAAFGFTSSNSVPTAPTAPDTKQTSAAAMLAKYQAWLGLTGQQKVEKTGVNLVSHNSVPSVTPSPYSHQANSFAPVRLSDTSNVLMHSPFQQQQQHHHLQQQQQQQSFLVHLQQQQQQQAMRLQHGGLTSAGPEVGFPVGDVDRESTSATNGPTERPDSFLHFDHNSSNSPKTSSAEDFFKYDSSNSESNERRHTDDDLGFDPFHETQKGLAEMIEKEQLMKQQLQSQLQLQHQQQLLQQAQFAAINQHNYPQHNQLFGHSLNHRLTPQVSNCTKLLEGLGLGLNNSVPVAARSRAPPPGFAPAPNHMNAFGLGITRTPSTSSTLGSKVLPFMGLSSAGSSGNNSSASSSSGSQSSQGPQPMSYMSNGSVLNQGMGTTTVDSMFASAKEWPENLRSLLPNLGNNISSQPPSHSYATQKSVSSSWNCPDWTALDPAIVSSSRPHWPVSTPINTPTPPPGFGFGQQLPHTLNTDL